MKETTESKAYMLTVEDQNYHPKIYVRNTRNDLIKFLKDVYSFCRHENHKEQIIKNLETTNYSSCYEDRYSIKEIKMIV